MKIVHGAEVFEELVNLSSYIAFENEAAAQEFLDACNETFQFLAGNNKIGAVRNFNNPLLKDVRVWRVKGFEKYLIFYQPIDDGIKILHVVHSARNWNTLFDDES